jgi:hypothetical protein
MPQATPCINLASGTTTRRTPKHDHKHVSLSHPNLTDIKLKLTVPQMYAATGSLIKEFGEATTVRGAAKAAI